MAMFFVSMIAMIMSGFLRPFGHSTKSVQNAMAGEQNPAPALI